MLKLTCAVPTPLFACLAFSCGFISLNQSILTAQTVAMTTEQWSMVNLVNKFRAQNGLAPLEVSVALQNASQWMAMDMATYNNYSFRDSLRRAPDARLQAFGYSHYWGEDIGQGYSDAQGIFNKWVTDCTPDPAGVCTYSHARFLLGQYWTVMGIGRSYNAASQYGWYWTIDLGQYRDATISQGSTPPPVITSFISGPSVLNVGAPTTLTWSVLNASTVTIDNNIGDVKNSTFKSVAPLATTTYKLTATNAGGVTTATTTITVNQLDSQAPTAPIIIGATAKSSVQIDLNWTASTDNIGVAGYQVYRNNSIVATLGGTVTTYSDYGVSPNTTYTYQVKAYDAATNFSNFSNPSIVSTPSPQTVACPAPGVGMYTGCYFEGVNLAGTPTKTTTDPQLMLDWSNAFAGRPNPLTNFSARWQGNLSFAGGNYIFAAVTSDGMRVFIDGDLALDSWKDQPPSMYTFTKALTAGNHLVVVEFYNRTGWPISYFWWNKQ